MIKTKTKLTQIVIIVLLALIMMTGGIVFLCNEIATPPAQIEENVDDIQADNGHNNIRWTTYGASGKIGGAVSGYVTSGYKGDQNYKGHYNKSPNNLVGTEYFPLPAIGGQKYRGFKFTSNFNNLNTGLEHGYVKVMSDGVVYSEGNTYGINGYYCERGGIGFAATVVWDVNVYWVVRLNIDFGVYPDNYNGQHYDGGSFVYRYTTLNNTGKWWWTVDGETRTGTPIAPTRKGYTFGGFRSGNNVIIKSNMLWSGYWNANSVYHTTLNAYWMPNTIKLTLNKNGGSGGTDYVWYKYNTNKFYSDSACTNQITSITRPTRAGYTFKGYQGDGTCGGTPNENYIAYSNTEFASDLCYDIYKNATLNAVWEVNNYNLKIDPVKGTYNNTTDLTSITQNYGTTYTYSTPTRTGYNFSGWHTGQNYLSAAKTFDGSSTYVAIGRSAMHTNGISVAVRASMNNWSEFKTSDMRLVSCTEGGGWNFEPNGEHIQFACYDSGVGYKPASSGIKWSELSSGYHTFVGTFDGEYAKVYIDGKLYGTSAKYSSGKIGYHASNGIFIGAEAGSNATTPVGSYFKGTIDYVAISSSGTVSNPTSFTFPAHNSASTAQWTAKTFDLIYHGNGGGTPSPTSKKITYDNLYGTLATVSRTGYTFNGWWTAATGGSRITENTKVTVTSNQTLYAHWTVNNYTVTWNGNGASLDAKLWSYAGSTGYTSSNSGSNSSYTYSGKSASSSVTYDVAISYKTPIPFKLGNTFNGWWTSASGGYMVANTNGQMVASVSGYTDANKKWIRAQATTLYAQWTQQSYSISYNLNGGYLSSQPPNSYTFGTSEAIGIPTRTGHTFAGWTVTATLTGKAYATINLSSGVMEFNNSYPTAVYFPLFYQRPNVLYSGKGSDQNGEIRWRQYSIGGAYLGSNSGSSSVECMTSLWYHGGMNSATTTITWNQNAGFYTIPSNQTGNLTLVAKWTVNSYKLTAKANSGSIPTTSGWTGTGATATKTVTYNAAYGTLPVPTKTGYGFAGWWTQASGGTQVGATTKMGAADTTIYAHWTISSYTLTADCHGGTAPSSLPTGWTANGQQPYRTLNYQSEYGTLPEPTRQGYIFAGWFTAASGGSEVNSSTKMGAANATIYARWVDSWVKDMSNDNPVLDQADGYYIIDSAQKLACLAYLVNYNIDNGKWASYQYKQTADINLSAHYWQPIGNATHPFKGTYDGTTFDIHNMKTYCGANDYEAYNGVGMFGYISGATIKNVNNYDVNIKGGYLVAGIVGSASDVNIINCVVSGNINADGKRVGGIVGYANGIVIKSCRNETDVSSNSSLLGGIIGDSNGKTEVDSCVNSGQIKNLSSNGSGIFEGIGGIVGDANGNSFMISNCINNGSVTSVSNKNYDCVGGIVGSSYTENTSSNSSILNCQNLGRLEGKFNIGGIAGCNSLAAIKYCLNTGDVNITSDYNDIGTGGIVGVAYNTGVIESCFVSCTLTTPNGVRGNVGAIIGRYAGTEFDPVIKYCGAKTTVVGNPYHYGVFVGEDEQAVNALENSYSLMMYGSTKVNRITATTGGMDDKFGMISSIHDGLPVPLGIYHTSQYGTTTGIASTLKGSQYGCTTA